MYIELKFDFQGVYGDWRRRIHVTLLVKIELWRVKQGSVIEEFIPHSVAFHGSQRKTECIQLSGRTKSVS